MSFSRLSGTLTDRLSASGGLGWRKVWAEVDEGEWRVEVGEAGREAATR